MRFSKSLLTVRTSIISNIGDKFLEPDGTLTRKIMPDLLHLSVEGYTIWAESIEPTLKKLMGE